MNITITENNLLQLAHKITNPYYLTFLGAPLVAVLEGLPKEHPDCQKYYQSCDGVTAVFFLKNPPIFNDKPNLRSEYFMFDDEYHACQHPDQDERAFAQAYVQENPVILYFKGCDDGSVGLRFPTEKDAMDYLSGLTYFEDVFKNPRLSYDN